MIRILTLSIIFLLSILQVKGQGTWNPAGADLSYPRTLLKSAAIPAVQNSIVSGPRYTLFSSLYGSAFTGIPGGNSTREERRERATLAKNAAFIVLLDRSPIAEGNLQPLSASDRNALVTKVKTLLENINTSVSLFAPSDWQWRSKELIDFMIAYDLLRGAGVPAESLTTGISKLQEFAGNLHQGSTSFNNTFYNIYLDHNGLMTAAALGLSAVVLNDASSTTSARQPSSWINNGMYNLYRVLWSVQSNPNQITGYAEGPYYFKDAFLNVLPFIRAMGNFLPDGQITYTFGGNTHTIRNPYYDPSYDLLYQWITGIAMPDGRFPALEDSYISMGMPELALTGKSQYVIPLQLDNLHSEQINTLDRQLGQFGYINVDMRAAYLAANLEPIVPNNNTLTAMPQSGNLVFRSDNNSQATYLHVYGKNGPALTNNGDANHIDPSSFILHAKGQLLALDPGFIRAEYPTDIGGAANHNLILVDGSATDAPGYIQNTFITDNLAYGEVQTTYNDANITRKTVFIRNTYFVMADFITAPRNNDYTWQLHGYGLENGSDNSKNDPGIFTDKLASQEGLWQKNGVKLQAHITALGGVPANGYTKLTSTHELGYDRTENHTALMVKKSRVANTQFLSLLYPFTATPATVTTTSTASTASLAATEAGFKDIAFTQSTNTSTAYNNGLLPSTITSNGLLTFFSLNSTNDFAQLLLEQGTSLIYGTTEIVKSRDIANVSWAKLDEITYEGYINRGTELTLSLPFNPTSVTGNNIGSYTYNEETKKLVINFNGESNFRIITALPVELLTFKAVRQNHLVKLNWQTATETQNAGFAILRKAEGEEAFREIGFVKGSGNAMSLKNYQFLDKNAPTVVTYYQLKQVDFDGKCHLSPVAAVPGLRVTSPTLLVSPVPADQDLRVTLLGLEKATKLRLTGVDGKIVLEQPFGGQITLDVSAISSGIYYLQALDANGRVVSAGKKIVVKH